MPALNPKTLDDCFKYDRDRLSHTGALDKITRLTKPIVGEQVLPLTQAHGRYAARNILASRLVPAFDNAAVDGYALAHEDFLGRTDANFHIAARIAAGDASQYQLQPNEVARIFTGARVPGRANTIIMQEDAEVLLDDKVRLPGTIHPGSNVRKAGEDLYLGDIIAKKGQRLRPQDVAALASNGFSEVQVHQKLRVGLISSGDEILRPGSAIDTGKIFDANSSLLRALAAPLAVDVHDLGIASDRREDVEDRLEQATRSCDLVITSGGASRGEEDYFVHVLAQSGTLHAWQIAVKPGRPLGFGTYNTTRILMLPGNPVAVMVCFMLYAMPLITRLGGGTYHEPTRYPVRADFEIKAKKQNRREFLRGTLNRREDGLWVNKYPRDGSGLISSLREANGLIELQEHITDVQNGDQVDFIPFSEFGILTK